MKQRSPEWHAARRAGVTSTDIAAILGISPYKSEGDVAREKLTGEEQEPDAATARRWRLGLAFEDAVRIEEETEHGIPLRRVRRLIASRAWPWALTSLDFERVGERCIVEIKTSTSRRWRDGLPQHIEAQVRWQMGVAGYPRAHVAALRFGSQLECFDLEHDEAQFGGMLVIASDFRNRLEAGGPFAETRESGHRAWPSDDGQEIAPDPQVEDAVADLLEIRKHIASLETRQDEIIAAVQMRMGPAALMRGPGWRVTWRRSKDGSRTDWKEVAAAYRKALEEIAYDAERIDAIESLYTEPKAGARPFILREEKDF